MLIKNVDFCSSYEITRLKNGLFLILLSVIWGSSYILIKKGLIGLTPLQLGSVRILMTTIILSSFWMETTQENS